MGFFLGSARVFIIGYVKNKKKEKNKINQENKLPYWFRGGLIGAYFFMVFHLILITLIVLLAKKFNLSGDVFGFFLVFLFFLFILAAIIGYNLGAVIGWIIGKIKEIKEAREKYR